MAQRRPWMRARGPIACCVVFVLVALSGCVASPEEGRGQAQPTPPASWTSSKREDQCGGMGSGQGCRPEQPPPEEPEPGIEREIIWKGSLKYHDLTHDTIVNFTVKNNTRHLEIQLHLNSTSSGPYLLLGEKHDSVPFIRFLSKEACYDMDPVNRTACQGITMSHQQDFEVGVNHADAVGKTTQGPFPKRLTKPNYREWSISIEGKGLNLQADVVIVAVYVDN